MQVFSPKIGTDEFEARELLTELLHVVQRRTLRAHRRMPSESEVLDALARMEAVLRKFGRDAEAEQIGAVLKEAQELMCVARMRAPDTAAETRAVPVGREEAAKLMLYRGMHAFEELLLAEAGEFTFQNQTIAFGEAAGAWDGPKKRRLKEEAERLRRVAEARHWLFHSTAAKFDISSVLIDMGKVLHRLRGIKDAALPLTADDRVADGWDWAARLGLLIGTNGHLQLRILLAVGKSGMAIPMARERCLVGRAAVISKLCAALCEPKARIWLHGMQSVGKDVVAAKVVLCEPICSDPDLQLQAWLSGSSTEMLQRQLLHVLTTQRPEALLGAANEREQV